MLLFHSILTFMKDLYQSENQVFNPTRLLVLLHCGVGKDWAGPFFPPPPSKMFWSFYLSFSLSVYVNFFTVSEDLWMTHSKEIIKFSNQKVYWLSPSKVFQPLYFILVNWFFQIVGWGKAGSDFPLTHSNNHFELRTYSFCFLNRLTIYNQILLHPLHFCAVLRVVEL